MYRARMEAMSEQMEALTRGDTLSRRPATVPSPPAAEARKEPTSQRRAHMFSARVPGIFPH